VLLQKNRCTAERFRALLRSTAQLFGQSSDQTVRTAGRKLGSSFQTEVETARCPAAQLAESPAQSRLKGHFGQPPGSARMMVAAGSVWAALPVRGPIGCRSRSAVALAPIPALPVGRYIFCQKTRRSINPAEACYGLRAIEELIESTRSGTHISLITRHSHV